MNIRELKRRLQPYSGYMKPIEDGGADSGGEVIDMAGDADGAEDGAGQEDRGDDFTPTADAEDGADGGETPPASAGAEQDGGDGHDGATASKGIPRGQSRSLGYALWPEPQRGGEVGQVESRSLGYALWPEPRQQ